MYLCKIQSQTGAPQAKKMYFGERRRQKTGILERAAGEKNGYFWQSGKVRVEPPGGGGVPLGS